MPKENQEWEDRFEFDFLHRSGSCAYNLIAICSAEEQRIKSFIQSELSKAREEERRKMLGKLTDEFYEFSTGKAWEAEQQEWVILHEPKEVIKRLTDAIKEING